MWRRSSLVSGNVRHGRVAASPGGEYLQLSDFDEIVGLVQAVRGGSYPSADKADRTLPASLSGGRCRALAARVSIPGVAARADAMAGLSTPSWGFWRIVRDRSARIVDGGCRAMRSRVSIAGSGAARHRFEGGERNG